MVNFHYSTGSGSAANRRIWVLFIGGCAGGHQLRAAQAVPFSQTWRRADERFLWNSQFLSDFMSAVEELPAIDEWVTPLICGYVDFQKVLLVALSSPFWHTVAPLSHRRFVRTFRYHH